MDRITKPMLAGRVEDVATVNFPVIGSPKLDGIRCLKVGGEILSRSFKQIPNRFINRALRELLPEGIDGEILSGDTFQETTSAVMRIEGEPDFTFHAFDIVTTSLGNPYTERVKELERAVAKIGDKRVVAVPTTNLNSVKELMAFEKKTVNKGFEGIMIRSPDGPYKCGRSTEREGYLLKIKRFLDAEARIIGVEELMHNENPAEKNELGRTKRSSAKAGKVPAGTLGKFVVVDTESGQEFRIGTGEGLTQELRATLWERRNSLIGLVVKYRSQVSGVKDAPRIPVFIGFRDERDMS